MGFNGAFKRGDIAISQGFIAGLGQYFGPHKVDWQTLGHDSHNLIVIGTNDDDMQAASGEGGIRPVGRIFLFLIIRIYDTFL